MMAELGGLFGLINNMYVVLDITIKTMFFMYALNIKPLNKKRWVIDISVAIVFVVVNNIINIYMPNVNIIHGVRIDVNIIIMVLVYLYILNRDTDIIYKLFIGMYFFYVQGSIFACLSNFIASFLAEKRMMYVMGLINLLISLFLFFIIVIIDNKLYKKLYYLTKKEKYIMCAIVLVFMIVLIIVDYKPFDYDKNNFGIIEASVRIHKKDDLLSAAISVLTLCNFYFYIKLSEHNKNSLNGAIVDRIKVYNDKYLEKILEADERISKIRHDINNHMNIMESMSDTSIAKKYISSIRDDIINLPIYIQTGNILVDIILNDKIAYMNENSIDYDIKMIVPKSITVEDRDLSSILFNSIDNAIEASLALDERERKIVIKCHLKGDFIQYTISNRYDEKSKSKSISDKGGISRGYGLKIIEEIVSKYDGGMKVINGEEIFTLKIFFRCM